MVAKTLLGGNKRKRTSRSAKLNLEGGYLQEKIDRLHAARKITENADNLAQGATNVVFHKFLVQQGVQERFETEQFTQKYSEVLEIVGVILKALAWSLATGEKALLDQYLLVDIQEVLTTLEHSSVWYTEALRYIKFNHNLTGEPAREIDTLINYLTNSLS